MKGIYFSIYGRRAFIYGDGGYLRFYDRNETVPKQFKPQYYHKITYKFRRDSETQSEASPDDQNWYTSKIHKNDMDPTLLLRCNCRTLQVEQIDLHGDLKEKQSSMNDRYPPPVLNVKADENEHLTFRIIQDHS